MSQVDKSDKCGQLKNDDQRQFFLLSWLVETVIITKSSRVNFSGSSQVFVVLIFCLNS